LDALLNAVKKVEEKVKFLIEISLLKDQMNINFNQICMLQKMALNKYKKVSIEDYAKSISKSREVARQELKDLVKKSLLKEEKQGRKYIYSIKSKELKKMVKNLS